MKLKQQPPIYQTEMRDSNFRTKNIRETRQQQQSEYSSFFTNSGEFDTTEECKEYMQIHKYVASNRPRMMVDSDIDLKRKIIVHHGTS